MRDLKVLCNPAVLIGIAQFLGRSALQDEKASGSMHTASRPAQGKIEIPRAQPQRWPAAALEELAAAHQTVRQRPGKALSKAGGERAVCNTPFVSCGNLT